MDDRDFDALARTLTEPGGRRGVLRLLATLPVFGGLLTVAAGEHEADAKSRRKRRKKRHKRRKRQRKQSFVEKFFVCHNGETLLLSIPAVKDHLAHGDTFGPCGNPSTQPLQSAAGTCTPLLQVCWPEWLGGNPCCDANAACLLVGPDTPTLHCLDQSTTACTSDTQCHGRFSDPNIACLDKHLTTCRMVFQDLVFTNVSPCCQRKLCPTGFECEGGVICCNSLATGLQNMCCAPGQTTCDPILGCLK